MHLIYTYFFALCILASCKTEKTQAAQLSSKISSTNKDKITTGAERLAVYFPLIKNKKIALVVNQTSMVDKEHLVDSLHKIGVNIKVVFAPEHGFRGDADAGEHISDSKDPNTGIPVLSLYGAKKKPSKEDLAGIEAIVFDIQDVGVRFYTYISTLHYIMESCAENNIPLIVLDRPNPNGHYVDGPVLKKEFTSFIGMHPVPVVYGMTIGEYAQMINGEGWLPGGQTCSLTVVELKNYTHDNFYDLPVKPSPNLPNALSISLYPSLCFFEGTTVSVGRGTDAPFQMAGHPGLKFPFSFVPKPNFGAKKPFHENKTCYGIDLRNLTVEQVRRKKQLDLTYLVQFHETCIKANEPFFLENLFFDKLAGTESLRKMLIENVALEKIRESWQEDLLAFEKIRKKYLLYE